MINHREELGDFSSVVCLKAIITGIEDALGDKATAIALISAGRQRGKNLAEQLGLKAGSVATEELAEKLNHALGKDGTRLCAVDKLTEVDGKFQVYTRETVCSAGESDGSTRECTFTLGAIQGALESFSGKRLRGKQIESVLRGSKNDTFEFSVLG